jgi:hypothetical protein
MPMNASLQASSTRIQLRMLGQDAPGFEDVARLDGNADCISKEDVNQFMNSLIWP